jgi:hypothetical protein
MWDRHRHVHHVVGKIMCVWGFTGLMRNKKQAVVTQSCDTQVRVTVKHDDMQNPQLQRGGPSHRGMHDVLICSVINHKGSPSHAQVVWVLLVHLHLHLHFASVQLGGGGLPLAVCCRPGNPVGNVRFFFFLFLL